MQIIKNCKNCELGNFQFETNKHCQNCTKAHSYILTKEEYKFITLIINGFNEKLDKILSKLELKENNIGKLKRQLHRYKQVIKEIKEIAENEQSFVDWTLEDDVYTEMKKIIQKCEEVNNAR